MHLPLRLPCDIVHQNCNSIDLAIAIQEELLYLFFICAEMYIFNENTSLVPILFWIRTSSHLLHRLLLRFRLFLRLRGILSILTSILCSSWFIQGALWFIAAICQCARHASGRHTLRLMAPIRLGCLTFFCDPWRLLCLYLSEESLNFILNGK